MWLSVGVASFMSGASHPYHDCAAAGGVLSSAHMRLAPPHISRALALLTLALLTPSAGCGGDDTPPPPPPPPTVLSVSAVDGATGAPVPGVELLLLGRGQRLTTGASGAVEVELDAGVFAWVARAPGYVALPRPGRPIPFVSVIAERTTPLVLTLEPLPGAAPGGNLSGAVTLGGAAVEGALVVATAIQSFSALTDAGGRWQMPGVAPGFYTVSAHVPGHTSSSRMNVDVSANASKEGVDLELTPSAGATLSGALTGGTGTSSVVLVHRESGDVVPGLSATASLDGGEYAITGIPPGRYVVRAGLELDGFTIDPQLALSEGPLEIDVTGTSSLALDLRFTRAIGDTSPTGGAQVLARPTFTWPPVPSATFYVVELTNVGGQVIFGGFDTRRRPRESVLAPQTSFTLSSMSLAPGALYTWRVYAAKDVTTGQLFELLSASEELDGELRVSR